MSDINTLHRPVELGSGEAAMARLAERLTTMTPPPMDFVVEFDHAAVARGLPPRRWPPSA